MWLEEDGDLKKTLSRYFLLPVQPVTRTVHQHCSRGCCCFPACLEQRIGLGLGASPVKVGSLEKLLKKKLNGLLALALFLPYLKLMLVRKDVEPGGGRAEEDSFVSFVVSDRNAGNLG